MANELGELFQDIADAIRGKTGGTETMKPAEFPAAIAGIEVGGGSSADVRYVTFMNEDGTEELYVKAVAVNDDCADVIARGLIETPTKESTAQYNYVHAGWATEPNGALDESALTSVTENRTVYAYFAAVTRYYTVTYLDDDGTTVLNAEQKAYGADASGYVPSKDGYAFEGWSLENDGTVDDGALTVTGDMSLYAIFLETGTLDDITWAEIFAASLDGTASTKYVVGDTKKITLTDTDGTTETIMAVIAGFATHRNTEGTKAGITFLLKRRGKYAVGNKSDTYYAVNSYDAARFPSDLLAVVQPTMIDCQTYDGTTVSTVTENVEFFIPELSNISSSLKATDGTNYAKTYNPYTASSVNLNTSGSTTDNGQFSLFSGMSAANIAKYFGLSGGGYAVTRTLAYYSFGSNKGYAAGHYCIQANSTYGLCKATNAYNNYPLICFRV